MGRGRQSVQFSRYEREATEKSPEIDIYTEIDIQKLPVDLTNQDRVVESKTAY